MLSFYLICFHHQPNTQAGADEVSLELLYFLLAMRPDNTGTTDISLPLRRFLWPCTWCLLLKMLMQKMVTTGAGAIPICLVTELSSVEQVG
jgi:hypothetical protein